MCEICDTWEAIWQHAETAFADQLADEERRRPTGDPTPFVRPEKVTIDEGDVT